MNTKKTFTTAVGDTDITVKFTDLAENTNGSVLVEAGDTVVLVTAVMEERESTKDYFPLSVEFEERFYSVGASLGSRYMRREGRPSQEAVLNARIIDRTIRPLFPKALHKEVQVIATIISFGTYNPDVLAVLGASLALGTSDIPWNGPVSGVRYALTADGWSAFAPFDKAREAEADVLVCGKENCITMIEMEGKEVAEADIARITGEALTHIRDLQTFQQKIIEEIGTEKRAVSEQTLPEKTLAQFDERIRPALKSALFDRQGSTEQVKEEWLKLAEDTDRIPAETHFERAVDEIIHTDAPKHLSLIHI